MKLFKVTIEGKSPLIMNRMTAEDLEKLRLKDRKTLKSNPPREAREQAKPRVYTIEGTEDPYMPVENFMSCLIHAGVHVKLDGKRQLSTSKSSLVPGLLTISETHLPLFDPKTGKTAAWEPDIRQGRNPNGGEAVCLVRPRFDSWAFEVHLLLDTDQLDEERLRDLIEMAGNRVGLCDFRPERRGIYGRFRVARWEPQDEARP